VLIWQVYAFGVYAYCDVESMRDKRYVLVRNCKPQREEAHTSRSVLRLHWSGRYRRLSLLVRIPGTTYLMQSGIRIWHS